MTLTNDQIAQIQALGRAVIGRPYLLGSKWDIYNPEPQGPVDCSGFSRWLVYRSTGVVIPDGSYNQIKVCTKLPVANQPKPPILSLGFFDPEGDPNLVDHVIVVFDDTQVIEARGNPYNEVIFRPIIVWQNQKGFLGFYSIPGYEIQPQS